MLHEGVDDFDNLLKRFGINPDDDVELGHAGDCYIFGDEATLAKVAAELKKNKAKYNVKDVWPYDDGSIQVDSNMDLS
jgi:hypothetical protein